MNLGWYRKSVRGRYDCILASDALQEIDEASPRLGIHVQSPNARRPLLKCIRDTISLPCRRSETATHQSRYAAYP